jgi:hypothetical protein
MTPRGRVEPWEEDNLYIWLSRKFLQHFLLKNYLAKKVHILIHGNCAQFRIKCIEILAPIGRMEPQKGKPFFKWKMFLWRKNHLETIEPEDWVFDMKFLDIEHIQVYKSSYSKVICDRLKRVWHAYFRWKSLNMGQGDSGVQCGPLASCSFKFLLSSF